MMPDAEPLIEAEPVDEPIVDVSDAAQTIEAAPTDAASPAHAASTSLETEPPANIGPPVAPHAADRLSGPRKICAIALIVVMLLGAAAVTLTRSPFFAADTIRVEGTSHLSRPEVLRMAGIHPETNVFTLDAAAAEARLERDPWVARATIMKDLPSTVTIDIQERFAVAVVQTEGGSRVVADDGMLLEAALPRTAAGLPTIGATEEGAEPTAGSIGGAARAIAAMAPTLRRRIDGVSILADGQLRVDLASGAGVAYGDAAEFDEKAMALRALLDYAADKGASVISADVRVPSAPTAILSGGEVAAP